MIAGVINQTICTAHTHLHKEVALTKYGVECKKDLWKPYMVSYLLQTLSYSTCDEAYAIQCAVDKLNKNLVTTIVCASLTDFTDVTCAVTLTQAATVTITCTQATIQEIN